MKSFTFPLAAMIATASLNMECQAFQSLPPVSRPLTKPSVVGPREAATARAFREEKPKNHFLLDEFKTYAGEVVSPYQTLNIAREADRTVIRRAYYDLSKRYHPDSVSQRDVLPGRCNNLDDVREEWERIKLSYEILSDKRTRRRYDRHEMLADPGAAAGRAAMDAMGKGITGLGKGFFNAGAFAAKQLAGGINKGD